MTPRLRTWIALGPPLALAALAGWSFWGYSYDDAFITYRYAESFSAGQGLTYNPGEKVLGTTAPGYAVALGVLDRLVPIGIPGWGTVLSLLGLLAPAALAAAAIARRRESFGPLFPALFGTIVLLLRFNLELLGAETLAILGLICAAAYAVFIRAAPVSAGLLLALAMAFRLDAALAAGAVGIVLWRHRRRFPLQLAAAGLLPLVLFLLWLHGELGTIIPNTLGAKQAEIPFALRGYATSEWLWLQRSLGLAGSLTLLALAVAGVVDLVRRGIFRRPIPAALALWIGSHEIAYHLLGVPFAPWYHVYTVNALAALAVWGALALARLPAAALGRLPRGLRRPATAALALLPLLPILAPSVAYLTRQWGRPPDPRFGIYAEIGRAIAAGSPPESEVAAIEIGVLGYTSRRPILDLAGLVSPEVLAWQEDGVTAERVVARRPRFIVDPPVFRERILGEILDREEIARCYRERASFTAPEYAGGRIRLLERDCEPMGEREIPHGR